MPRTSRLSQRLAAEGRARQEEVTRLANRAAEAVDRLIGRWWRALVRALADPRGNWQETSALLRALAPYVRTNLQRSLVRVARRARNLAVQNLLSSLTGTYLEGGVPVFPAPPLERTQAAMARLLETLKFHGGKDRVPPERLAEVVARGMAQGKTQREIAKDLLPLANDVRASAMRVSRTWGMYVAGQESQEVHNELGDLVIGYQVHASIDQNTRAWHAARDKQVYYLHPGPGQKGMEKCPHPPLEAADPTERPAKAPRIAWNCILPGQEVQGRFVAGSKSFYSGQAIEITGASGFSVRVTANHPVLTQVGFVPAHKVYKGDYIASYVGGVNEFSEHKKDRPALIEDVFGSIKEFGRVVAYAPGVGEFHGDSRFFEGQVEVVFAQLELLYRMFPHQSESVRKGEFISSGGCKALVARFCSGNFDNFGINLSPARFLRGGSLESALGSVGTGPFCSLGFGLAAQLHASRYKQAGKPEWSTQTVSSAAPGNTSFFGKLVNGFPGEVATDEIVQVRKFDFSGHVYDLQGDDGWIVANNIFISNCRCYLTPVLRSERDVRRKLVTQ